MRGLRLGPQDTVVISAAAGGVGHIQCQLAHDAGATVIALGYAAERSWKALLAWFGYLAFGLAVVVVSKVAFIGWGIGVRAWDFTGFSGHAERATMVMPVLCYTFFRQASATVRHVAVALGFLTALGASLSRYVLHCHSVSEVIGGALLGSVLAAAFIAGHGRAAAFSRGLPLVLAGGFVLLVAPRMEPGTSQHLLTDIALRVSGHHQPFTRDQWLRRTFQVVAG